MKSFVIVVVLVTLLVAACGTPPPVAYEEEEEPATSPGATATSPPPEPTLSPLETPELPALTSQLSPPPTPQSPASEADIATQAAVTLLARGLEVAEEQVKVVAVEAVQWANSCLGCAARGENCLMVITPGYRVALEVDGRTYEVHTDRTGRAARLCSEP